MKKEKERKEKKTVSHHNYKSKYKNNAVFSSLFQLGERAQLSKIDKRLAGGGKYIQNLIQLQVYPEYNSTQEIQ